MHANLAEKQQDEILRARNEQPNSSGAKAAKEFNNAAEYYARRDRVIEALRGVLNFKTGAWYEAKRALDNYDAEALK